MSPSFDRRCAEALRLLAEHEVPGWNTVPAIYRFLWSRGLNLRPPHFASWEANFFIRGGFSGAVSGGIYWLATLATGDHELAIFRAAGTAVFVTVGYGFATAARHKREAEDHGLPQWDELCEPADAFD